MRFVRLIFVVVVVTSVLAGHRADAKMKPTPITTCGFNALTPGSYKLTTDLTCTSYGIAVFADGVKIDLGGHVLRGDWDNGDYGILDTAGYENLTVRRGAVRNFDVGVLGIGANDVHVARLVASGNRSDGIGVNGDRARVTTSQTSGNGNQGISVVGEDARVSSSQASGNASDGIYLQGSSTRVLSSKAFGNGGNGIRLNLSVSARVSSSQASGNVQSGISISGGQARVSSSQTSGNGADGITIEGDGAHVISSRASGNGEEGIDVSGDQPKIDANRAQANGSLAGVSDEIGVGIWAHDFIAGPVGHNAALGNDDPDECLPASMCTTAHKQSKKPATPIGSCPFAATAPGRYRLTADLDCSGSGVVVGADGVTIDLGGHTLHGDLGSGEYGVDDSGGYDDLTVLGGVVRNFDVGVYSNEGDDLHVRDVVVSGNLSQGILDYSGDDARISSSQASGNVREGIDVSGLSPDVRSCEAFGNGRTGIHLEGESSRVSSSRAGANGMEGIRIGGTSSRVKSSQAVANATDGIYINGQANVRVISSQAFGNHQDGVDIDGASAHVTSSQGSGNGEEGIDVSGDAPKIDANRAQANGFAAGASDEIGVGIWAHDFTAGPVGHNAALGNDDPDECLPVSLC